VELNNSDSRTMSHSLDVHLNRLMTEKYVFISGRERFGPHVDCYVSFVGEKLFQYEYANGMPFGSPLKKDFDKVYVTKFGEEFLLYLEIINENVNYDVRDRPFENP